MWSKLTVGPIQMNVYVLSNEQKECLIFDPGFSANKIARLIDEQQLKPLAILLTHAHFDHIGAVDDIRKQYNIPVYIHQNEQEWLENPELNGSSFFQLQQPITAKAADHLLYGDKKINIGSFTFQTLETPGHSPGSVSYYFPDLRTVVSGDVLFKNSIGRTDLHEADEKQLLSSIHHKLLNLPEDTKVLPGHGPNTSIISEMESNPFINGYSL